MNRTGEAEKKGQMNGERETDEGKDRMRGGQTDR